MDFYSRLVIPARGFQPCPGYWSAQECGIYSPDKSQRGTHAWLELTPAWSSLQGSGRHQLFRPGWAGHLAQRLPTALSKSSRVWLHQCL